MLLCTENWATLVLNQLNRWAGCRSAERCRTLYKKIWCRWAVRPFTICLCQLAVFIRFIGRHRQDQNTTNGKRITRKWPLDLSFTANEVRAFRTVFLFDLFDLIYGKICAWLANGRVSLFSRKGPKTCILTNFEKLSRRSQSFAQRNFCSNLENIFS